MSELRARLRLPTGTLELAVRPGEVALLDEDADAAVAALTGAAGTGRGHRVVVGGRALHRRTTAGRVRAGLGIVVGAPVAADVSVLDHLAARTGAARARDLLERAPLLAGRGRDPAGVLSGGERRVLAWLRCVAGDPHAVVLARAGTGLDPDALEWAVSVIDSWREQGVALVVQPGRPEERAWAAR